jgi:hypothetical protein
MPHLSKQLLVLAALTVALTAGECGTTSPVSTPSNSPPPVIGSFAASPTTILAGQASTLSWSGITNATKCSIDNQVGQVPCADGHVSVSPASTPLYTLVASGPGANAQATAMVTVNANLSGTWSGAFAMTEGSAPGPSGTMTMILTQVGTTITGTATWSLGGSAVAINGSASGGSAGLTLTNNPSPSDDCANYHITFTVTALAGALTFTGISGFQCVGNGTGGHSALYALTGISGSLLKQ